MNIARLPKEEYQAILKHKKRCRWNHYSNMEKGQALRIKANLTKGKAATFVSRVNHVKGYEFT